MKIRRKPLKLAVLWNERARRNEAVCEPQSKLHALPSRLLLRESKTACAES